MVRHDEQPPPRRGRCRPDRGVRRLRVGQRPPLDREALDLACVGTLAQVGAFAAYFSVKGDTEESRLLANRLLGWWVRRAATALDRTAPP